MALAALSGPVLYVLLLAPPQLGLPVAAGALGLGAAGLLLGWQGAPPAAAAVVGAGYLGLLYASGRGLDAAAPLLGAALLAWTELAQVSFDLRHGPGAEAGVLRPRLLLVWGLACASAAAGLLMLLLAAQPLPGGLPATAAGLAAALAALALLAWLARRSAN